MAAKNVTIFVVTTRFATRDTAEHYIRDGGCVSNLTETVEYACSHCGKPWPMMVEDGGKRERPLTEAEYAGHGPDQYCCEATGMECEHGMRKETYNAMCLRLKVAEDEVERLKSILRERTELQIQANDEHRATLDSAGSMEAEIDRLKTWIDDLQSGMYINCVYCGHRYGPQDNVPASMADVLKEHVEQCPKHPMSKLKAEVERLRAIEKAANTVVANSRKQGVQLPTYVIAADYIDDLCLRLENKP